MKLVPVLIATAIAVPALAQQPPQEKLSDAQIKSTVDAHVGDIKACMKENGGVTGKLVLLFGVLPSGVPSDFKIKEASSNAGLDKCIAGAFKKFQFPKRTAGPFQGVEYPLVFSAPKPPPGPPPLSQEEQKQIADTMKSHANDVRDCYDKGIEENSELNGGQIDVDVTITQDGVVAAAGVKKTTVKSPKVESCLTDALKKWKFPKRQVAGNITIGYPFVMLEKKK